MWDHPILSLAPLHVGVFVCINKWVNPIVSNVLAHDIYCNAGPLSPHPWLLDLLWRAKFFFSSRLQDLPVQTSDLQIQNLVGVSS